MSSLEDVGKTAEAIRADLETAFVRGLSASSSVDRRALGARTEEWERIGANHVASRLRAALHAADAGAKDAPRKWLSAYTSLHTFERVLSLEVARAAWAQRAVFASGDDATASGGSTALSTSGAAVGGVPPKSGVAAFALDDPKGTTKLANELALLVEDLVRTGLTSATVATRARLDAAFKEASGRKLPRLGAALRYVSEEVGRFLADDGAFTSRRYSFFLHRSWLLSRGTSMAIANGDARLVSSLAVGTGASPSPVEGPLEVVTLGVAKRAAASVCTFDFRLRVTKSKRAALRGKSLVYSLVFARKPGVPAEAYLHLPQPQKFAPKLFRDGAVVTVTGAAIVPDDRGGGRLMLGANSTVAAGKPFDDWAAHHGWDPDGAAARAIAHEPTPLDLAVELSEEVVFTGDWTLVTAPSGPPSLIGDGLSVEVVVAAGEEGREMLERLQEASKAKSRPPLFGTVHYENARVCFTPLSLLADDGPDYLQLSKEKVNLAALLGSFNP